MKRYLLFVITDEGEIRADYQVKCRNDRDAIARAERFYSNHPIEVWDGQRRVARITSKAASDG